MDSEAMVFKGELVGHGGWVTQIATCGDLIYSSSRDKSIIQWQLTREEENYGYAKRSFTGHSHFVEDIALSNECNVLLSGSWDGTLRLWDVDTGKTTKRFVGHTKDVLSVAFSSDNRQIASGSRDTTIKLWNTLGECKYTISKNQHADWVPSSSNPYTVASSRVMPTNSGMIDDSDFESGREQDSVSVGWAQLNPIPVFQRWQTLIFKIPSKIVNWWRAAFISVGTEKPESVGHYNFQKWRNLLQESDAHTEWVSQVRFSPNEDDQMLVTAGWDKIVKVWSLSNMKLRYDLVGHTGYINAIDISPDGSLIVSGGKDGQVMIWDLNEGKRLYTLDVSDTIHALVFSPNRYWVCAAAQISIKCWDLESKIVVDELKPEFDNEGKGSEDPYAISLAWSFDGQTLFAGYTDNIIRVWQLTV